MIFKNPDCYKNKKLLYCKKKKNGLRTVILEIKNEHVKYNRLSELKVLINTKLYLYLFIFYLLNHLNLSKILTTKNVTIFSYNISIQLLYIIIH